MSPRWNEDEGAGKTYVQSAYRGASQYYNTACHLENIWFELKAVHRRVRGPKFHLFYCRAALGMALNLLKKTQKKRRTIIAAALLRQGAKGLLVVIVRIASLTLSTRIFGRCQTLCRPGYSFPLPPLLCPAGVNKPRSIISTTCFDPANFGSLSLYLFATAGGINLPPSI